MKVKNEYDLDFETTKNWQDRIWKNMPASPWRTFGTPDPNYDFVVLLSFLPLKSYWRVLPFFFYTAQVVWQLVGARGLVGYSLLARPFKKQFWTLSAWRNEGALGAFVQHPPHVHVM